MGFYDQTDKYTEDDVLDQFFFQLRQAVNNWSREDLGDFDNREYTVRERLEGMAFNFLTMLDGVAGMPPITLVIDLPQEEGEEPNQYTNGMEINKYLYLHDLWHEYLKKGTVK